MLKLQKINGLPYPIKAYADELGVSLQTLRSEAKKGFLTITLIGKKQFITENDFQNYLESKKTGLKSARKAKTLDQIKNNFLKAI